MIRDIIIGLLVLTVIGLSWAVLTDETMTPGFKEKISRLKRHVERIQNSAVIKKPFSEHAAHEKNRQANDPNGEVGRSFGNPGSRITDKINPEPGPRKEPQVKEEIPQPTFPKTPFPKRLEQNKELKLSTKELQEILGLLKEARDALRDSALKYPKRPETQPDKLQDQSSIKKKSLDGPKGSELSRP